VIGLQPLPDLAGPGMSDQYQGQPTQETIYPPISELCTAEAEKPRSGPPPSA
jgi:hypothetical protein